MGNMADYVLINDGNVHLVKDGDIDQELSFFIPGNARVSEGSILTFRITTSSTASALQVRVRINGADEWTYPVPLSGRHCFSTHELLDPGQLKEGNNVVKFTLLGASGSMTISDVYVTFRESN